MTSITFSILDWQKICNAFHFTTEEAFAVLKSLNKSSPISLSMTNETTGMTAEKAMCIVFNIKNNIEEKRVNIALCDKFLRSNVIADICHRNAIMPHTHIGKDNGKTDFLGISNGKEVTISLKTLKKSDGKICPQGGQPTYTSFHKTWHPECPQPALELSRLEANTQRWNWITANIGDFLNKMQKQLFCCDILILICDCDKTPKAQLLENKQYDFTKMDIGFNRSIYVEPPHKKKMGEKSEFSTNVFRTLSDGTKMNIGEFQFHFRGRNVIKFRFYNRFYY